MKSVTDEVPPKLAIKRERGNRERQERDGRGAVEGHSEIAAHVPVRAELKHGWGLASRHADRRRRAQEIGGRGRRSQRGQTGAGERERKLHWPPQNRRADARFGGALRSVAGNT